MRTRDIYFVEIAKPIAQRVVYPFDLVYDMVLMGLSAEEIETLCRRGAAVALPSKRLVYTRGPMPSDMYDLAAAYLRIKTIAVLENMEKLLLK